ncbi:uncharacterized [Tachysurus ichikawai]
MQQIHRARDVKRYKHNQHRDSNLGLHGTRWCDETNPQLCSRSIYLSRSLNLITLFIHDLSFHVRDHCLPRRPNCSNKTKLCHMLPTESPALFTSVGGTEKDR